jgi:hypothetical protein
MEPELSPNSSNTMNAMHATKRADAVPLTPASDLQQAMQASKQHQPADDLISGLHQQAASFQSDLMQAILDATRGEGYDRKTHLTPLLALRRGMEVVGQGSPIDVRNTILIVTQLKALVWASAALAVSTNPLEHACYDWRYHMDLVTAFNVETSILQNQLMHQQGGRAYQ